MRPQTHLRPSVLPGEERVVIFGFGCGICLDFGYLPGLGPCPDCRPDEHAEFVATLLEHTAAREIAA